MLIGRSLAVGLCNFGKRSTAARVTKDLPWHEIKFHHYGPSLIVHMEHTRRTGRSILSYTYLESQLKTRCHCAKGMRVGIIRQDPYYFKVHVRIVGVIVLTWIYISK